MGRTKGKSIKENNSFLSVCEFKLLDINDVQNACKTSHMSQERIDRMNMAYELNKLPNGKQAPIDSVFLVDKGHEDGVELHCVTEKGIIYILNKRKFFLWNSGLITILIARPHQVKRLYDECELDMPPGMESCCAQYERNGYNI